MIGLGTLMAEAVTRLIERVGESYGIEQHDRREGRGQSSGIAPRLGRRGGSEKATPLFQS
jgi:hypothetical protein